MLKQIKDFFYWPLGDLLRSIRNLVLFVVAFISVVLVLSWLDVYGLLHGTSQLVVFTNHSRADIYIDGKHKGTSPANTDNGSEITVHGGSHTVEVVLPSDGPTEKYAIKEDVSVADGEEACVTLKLHDRINAAFKEKLLKKYHGNIPQPTMVPIPGGSFIMGEEAASGSDNPPHTVILSPFLMSTTEITFDQYDACVVDGGCDHCPNDRKWGRGDRPVINVSWHDAQQYIAWLNQQTGKLYRLPTEAQWEYAARAGSTTLYSWGDDIGNNRANCKGCGSPWDDKQTAPVGSFAPNAFGLYDMHGNVSEWCRDWYYDDYYRLSPERDPQGLATGLTRVVRGGAWYFSPKILEAARRGSDAPDRRFDVGFRLVLPSEESVQVSSTPVKSVPVKSTVYVGTQVAVEGCDVIEGEPEPMELWYETLGADFIRGWLRSGVILGRFSGPSLEALQLTWPIRGVEEKISPAYLTLTQKEGRLRAALSRHALRDGAAQDPCEPMYFELAPSTEAFTLWLAQVENDYYVKKYLSDAEFWREQKAYPQARASYEQALDLKKLLREEESLAAAEVMDGLTELCFRMKRYDDAKAYARHSLEIHQRLQGKSAREVLIRMLRLASYHKQLREYRAAQELLQQGLAEIETTPGKEGLKAFQTLLADINQRIAADKTKKHKNERDSYDELGHSAITSAIRDGESAQAVRLIEESPDSLWLVVWKVFREVAEPGIKVRVLGEGEAVEPYPLLAAVAAMGDEAVAQALLSKGARVNERLSDGSTALMFAAKMHHLGMVRLLLAAGADPDLSTRTQFSNDAFGFALERADSGDDELVALELLQPRTVQEKIAGYTIPHTRSPLARYSSLELRVLLETAAYRGLGQVMRRMAALGAPLDGRNALGATLLHYALMGASPGGDEVALYLLDHGADPNGYYATEQQLEAARSGRFTAPDRRTGKTPLLLAIDEDASDELITQLLQRGADAHLPSLAGVTPVQLAENKGRTSLVALLERYGAQK